MHKQPAQMIVEFGIIAPILIILAFGILGFGRAFYTHLDLANAARSGALYAVSSPAKPCGTEAQRLALESQVQTQVRRTQPNLEWSSSPTSPPSWTPPAIALTCLSDRRSVTITNYQFDTMVPLLNSLLTSGTVEWDGVLSMSAAATMPLIS
jgi:Flp pilus assembly protein TadG